MQQYASRVGDFTSSVGVNTHAAFYWTVYGNTSLVENALSYLGVSNVRDQLQNTGNAALFQQIHNATGVKFDFSVFTGSGSDVIIGAIEGLGTGVVNAVEGANEPDVYGPSAGAAQQAQITLYKDIKSTLGVPVIQTSFGGIGDYGSTGDQSAYADYGNAHTYFGTGNNPGWAGWIGHLNSLAQETTPGKPVAITETGFYTTGNSGDASNISETAAAKYTLDMLLDAYQQGDVKSYLYELLDENTGDGNNEHNFGLFHSDGSAKPAATAVHNLMSLLSDGGNSTGFGTGSLGYSLSGMPSSGNSMLMEKSDGSYWLAVWNDARVAGPNPGQVDTVSNVGVTLNLDSPASSVNVFDPLTGTSSVESASNSNNVSLSLPDHPILVEITPGGSISTPVSTAPAPVAAVPAPTSAAPTSAAPAPAPSTGGNFINEAAGQSSVVVTNNGTAINLSGNVINETAGQSSMVATNNGTTINLNGLDNTVYLQSIGDIVNGSAGNVLVMGFVGGSQINLSGGNDHVQIANTGSVVDLKGPQNVIEDSGDKNTIVLEPGADDQLYGNFLSHDVFDLRPALSAAGWSGDSNTLGQYVNAASNGNDTSIQVSGKEVAYLHETGYVSTATILAHSVT